MWSQEAQPRLAKGLLEPVVLALLSLSWYNFFGACGGQQDNFICTASPQLASQLAERHAAHPPRMFQTGRSELGSEPRRRPFGRRVRPSRGGRVIVKGTCSALEHFALPCPLTRADLLCVRCSRRIYATATTVATAAVASAATAAAMPPPRLAFAWLRCAPPVRSVASPLAGCRSSREPTAAAAPVTIAASICAQ